MKPRSAPELKRWTSAMASNFEEGIKNLLSAWKRGEVLPRVAIVVGFVLLLSLAALVTFGRFANLDEKLVHDSVPVIGGIAAVLLYAVGLYERLLEDKRFRTKIDRVEKQIRENPHETQLAWELAQTKLESYLNRNLAQVRSIFWLTVVVMVAGFCFVLFGVVRAFDSPDKLPVAVIASVSGTLISFIGGSFLIIYRSTLTQSKDYVAVLERINAVGMAVQILETIPAQSSELKSQTTAEIAKQLLRLYAPSGKHGSVPAENG